jgi:hypothetical protein
MQFGQAQFGEEKLAPQKDAFEVVTGEVLQNLIAADPERRYLKDESAVDLALKIHAPGKTSAAKDREVAPYVGVWLVVRFALGDHVSRFGMEIVRPVSVGDDYSQRLGLTCIFDTEPWGEKVAQITVGTVLTVAGTIEQLGPSEIRLRACELI